MERSHGHRRAGRSARFARFGAPNVDVERVVRFVPAHILIGAGVLVEPNLSGVASLRLCAMTAYHQPGSQRKLTWTAGASGRGRSSARRRRGPRPQASTVRGGGRRLRGNFASLQRGWRGRRRGSMRRATRKGWRRDWIPQRARWWMRLRPRWSGGQRMRGRAAWW